MVQDIGADRQRRLKTYHPRTLVCKHCPKNPGLNGHELHYSTIMDSAVTPDSLMTVLPILPPPSSGKLLADYLENILTGNINFKSKRACEENLK